MNFFLYYISDLHSRYEKLAQIRQLLTKYRNSSSLFFDIGDNADFMRVETIGTKGEISTTLMDLLQCDARVIGNNEGFPGLEYTKNMIRLSKTPFITCNLSKIDGSELEGLQTSIILNKNNARFLVIGVTAPYNNFYELFGLHSSDPKQAIISEIRKYSKNEYDFVLLLSHLGLETDKMIALEISELDVILGGHTHTTLAEPIKENGCIIAQAGCYGEYLGILNVDLNLKEKTISGYKGNLIEVKNTPLDEEVGAIIETFTTIAHKNLSQPLFNNEFELEYSLTDENTITNLLADTLKHTFPCDFGLINSGVLNGGICIGNVSKLDFHEICPSPLNPTLIRIKGKYLRTAIENSLLEEFQLHQTSGDGFRGKYIGNLQVSDNVKIKFTKIKDTNHRISEFFINGTSLKDNSVYTITTSDHLQRGHAYLNLAKCELVKYHPDFLKDQLEIYATSIENRKKARKRRYSFTSEQNNQG